ncbi:hypothetical protein AB0O76_33585 [Streptomyces sp. NPDC086554]|uniref:hypothetical protein n=1 Tax=Streptomyces sp. NPDC086554 TaxID=3154864 RepID=UPI003445C8DE
MNIASRFEAAEISDAELDNVSGGNAAGGSGGLFLETPHAHACADLTAVASTEGLAVGASVHAAAL